MVADVVDETAEVVIVKVAEVAPVGTVTDGATTALAVLDDKLMTVPPVGAGPLKVM